MELRKHARGWRVTLMLLCIFTGVSLWEASATTLSNVRRGLSATLLADDSVTLSDHWWGMPETPIFMYDLRVTDAEILSVDCGGCTYELSGSQINFFDIKDHLFIRYRSPFGLVAHTGAILDMSLYGQYNHQNLKMDAVITMTFPITYSFLMSEPVAQGQVPGQATWQFDNTNSFSVYLALVDPSRLIYRGYLPLLIRHLDRQRR